MMDAKLLERLRQLTEDLEHVDGPVLPDFVDGLVGHGGVDKDLVFENGTSAVFMWDIAAGTCFAAHTAAEPQLVVVLGGEMRVVVDGADITRLRRAEDGGFILGAGEHLYIKGDTKYSGFCPVRTKLITVHAVKEP